MIDFLIHFFAAQLRNERRVSKQAVFVVISPEQQQQQVDYLLVYIKNRFISSHNLMGSDFCYVDENLVIQ